MRTTKKILHEPQRGRIIHRGRVIVPDAIMTIHHDGWTEAIVPHKKLVTHVYEILAEEANIVGAAAVEVDDAIIDADSSDRKSTVDSNDHKPTRNIPCARPSKRSR
jgi:hypothetical protein